MSKHDFHPVCDLFPMISGAAFNEFVADIKANGLREPIWLYDGKIIDGRNRYNACRELGIEPTYREWDGNGDLTKLVVSLNLHRRHLNETQRSLIAGKIINRPVGWEGHSKVDKSTLPPAAEEVAKMLNVSRASAFAAKKVLKLADPEMLAAVERGEIGVNTAMRKLPRTSKAKPEPSGNGRSGHPRTKTRRITGLRKAPEAVRAAIGTLVGLASGFDSFTAKDAAPTAEEAAEWEKELASVISALNRFRRQLKEAAHVQ